MDYTLDLKYPFLFSWQKRYTRAAWKAVCPNQSGRGRPSYLGTRSGKAGLAPGGSAADGPRAGRRWGSAVRKPRI